MKDSICPICGKPNPNTVEICQSCGAVLKDSATVPLPTIRPGDKPVKKKTSDLENTLPGWLRDVRKASKKSGPLSDPNVPESVEPSSDSPAPQKPDFTPRPDLLAGLSHLDDEVETPDWLKNLQSTLPGSASEELPPSDDGQTLEQNLPSNLSDLDSTENSNNDDESITFQVDDGTQPTVQSSETTPDWLNQLYSQNESRKPVEQSEKPSPPIDNDPSVYADLPDWLAELTGNVNDAPIPAPHESIPAESDPSPKIDTPDWLLSLGGDFTAEESSSPIESNPINSVETPDWLARMGAEPGSVEDNTPLPDQPSWLADLDTSISKPAPSASEPAETDLPDWMAGQAISAQANQPQDTPAANPPEALPDWMTSLQDFTSQPEKPEVSDPVSSPDLPDWLSKLQNTAAAATVEAAKDENPEVRPAEGMPDWMIETINAKPAEQPVTSLRPFDTNSLAEIAPPESDNQMPGAIVVFGESSPQEMKTNEQDFLPLAVVEAPDSNTSNQVPPVTEKPDWLSSFATDAEPVDSQTEINNAADEAPIDQGQPAFTKESQAEWGSSLSLPDSDKNIDSIFSMETPDWLSGFTPAAPEPNKTLITDDQPDSDLHQAELPSWVQAMRPVESVMVETNQTGDDQEIENQGPLAGLHSVLPIQSGQFARQIVGGSDRKEYLTGLLSSETQQAQAALLENLINSENTPQLVMKRSGMIVNRPLRWIISAILIAAVLIPAAFGSVIFPAPVMPDASSPLALFAKAVTNLPAGAPVLIVVDYQPGFAGEMEAVAGPVMEELMSKKMRLAFVSTSPVGGLMADRLLQKFNTIYPYQLGVDYVNLGYLPGGAGGIKVFAEQPRSTIGQDVLLGNLWDTPVLHDVTINQETRLSNFAAVIIATDNPDLGRLWIEQAQPELKTKPMLMLVSAQAEPMIRPYFLSKQLDGLLSGLEGAVIYENALGKPGQARSDWDAFGAGMLVIELIIILGGVWSFITGFRARRAVVEQDEA